MTFDNRITQIPDPVYCLKSDLRNCAVKPNRLKGQNFLISSRVRDYIANVANLSETESVIEIGPGTGILSWALAAKNRNMTLVESESSLVELLTNRFKMLDYVTVIEGDGLHYLKRLAVADTEQSHKIVSNLPYSLSSPVLMIMAEHPDVFNGAVLLLQKEVVDRVIASPRDTERSALSVIIQLRFVVRKVLNVKSTHFQPVPRVDSAVLTMASNKTETTVPWNYLVKTVHQMFTHRRKTLFNNLKKIMSDAMAQTILLASGIDMDKRAQELTIEQFVNLAETKLRAETEI
jgi:16S rRNA (adenine1518-N6/adenine1519-N6)-dimethyltransferase